MGRRQCITWNLMGVTIATVLFCHIWMARGPHSNVHLTRKRYAESISLPRDVAGSEDFLRDPLNGHANRHDTENMFQYSTSFADSFLLHTLTDDRYGSESTHREAVLHDAMATTYKPGQTTTSIHDGNTYDTSQLQGNHIIRHGDSISSNASNDSGVETAADQNVGNGTIHRPVSNESEASRLTIDVITDKIHGQPSDETETNNLTTDAVLNKTHKIFSNRTEINRLTTDLVRNNTRLTRDAIIEKTHPQFSNETESNQLAVGSVVNASLSTLKHDMDCLIYNQSSRCTVSRSPSRLHVRPVGYLERVFPKRNDAYGMGDINCARVMAGQGEAEAISYSLPFKVSDKVYKVYPENCEVFIRSRGYIMSAANQEEEDFPIAFSMLVYRSIFMGERLLRAIYRPQNYYCVHVDNKSHPEFRQSWEAIARCFPNVFLTKTSYDVAWGGFSVILPEIQCMRELLAYKWKYFINLTGYEFPLKTNWELVQILRTYNGSNDVDTFHEWTIEGKHNYRFAFKLPAPHGIRPLKGYAHGTFSRAFVEYVVHSPVARDFLEWLNGTLIPDETFFGSLQHGNPHLNIPGSFIGDDDAIISKPSMTRFKIFHEQPAGRRHCPGGFWLRIICQLSVQLLPQLAHTPKLFLNKVYPVYHPAALNCLEEFLYNRTVGDYRGERRINTTFYENLPFVKSHV